MQRGWKCTIPLGTETYEYDQFDRLVKHKLDGVMFATVVYDEFSDIQKINYPAGIHLSSITRDSLGRENGNAYTLASGQTLSDQIERYVSGDIKQGVELGVQKSYTYDNAGRLTSAKLGDNTFSYEFGTPHESCTALPGSNPHTAKSGNRTKLTMNGKAITFCYDHADRLVSASDPSLTNVQYDSHGNTISLGDAAHKTEFTYDAADRNTAIRSGNKQTRYVRDAQDRILSRTHTQAGTPDTTTHYGFTGSGDTPDFTTDAAGNLTQKYLTLPGDVLVTITPNAQSAGATTFSLPNIHGDIFATINADGSLINTFMTGPFGEALPNQANPTNTTPGTTYHYVGQYQKMTELESSAIMGGITQMGARVYLPILGRFLQVDPVEGGTDNNYAYANDPVNEFDLDGRAIPIIAGALYVGGIAWSAYDYYKNPTRENAFWLGVSFIPGGGLFSKSRRVLRVSGYTISGFRVVGKFTSKYGYQTYRCATNLGRCTGYAYSKIQRRVNRFTHHQAYRRLNLQNQRRKQYTQRKGRYGQDYRYQRQRYYRR